VDALGTVLSVRATHHLVEKAQAAVGSINPKI